MRKLLIFAVIITSVLFLSVVGCTSTTVITERTQATVIQVIDGDNIEVDIDGSLFRVNYIGMDAPKQGMVGYEEAKSENAQLVSGKVVDLEKDVSETDKAGRLLRYVWIKEDMVNAILVASGYAQVVTEPPNVKYQDKFLELQEQAQQAKAGLWTEPNFCTIKCHYND